MTLSHGKGMVNNAVIIQQKKQETIRDQSFDWLTRFFLVIVLDHSLVRINLLPKSLTGTRLAPVSTVQVYKD